MVVLLAGVPFLSVLQPADSDLELPPRRLLYSSAAITLWILAALTAVVLVVEDVDPAEIGLHATSLARLLGWSIGVAVLVLAVNAVISRTAARLGARESRLAFYLIPQTRRERGHFLLLSATAGFCEEFVYHGYVVAGLAAWLGSGWWAAAVANTAFGVLHGYQNTVGVVRAAAMGYVLTLPVLLGFGLWPGIVAHFLVDASVGLGLWRWLLPQELRPDDDEAVEP